MSREPNVATRDQQQTDQLQQPQSKGELVAAGSMKLRLPYPQSLEEYAGIDKRMWQVLIDAVWPAAQTVEAVCLAIQYCKNRNLDPVKKMVHIVPVWSKTGGPEGKGGLIETIWPAIAEIRTTAARTGSYAGKDAAVFGPDITKMFKEIDTRNDAVKDSLEVTFPEWCQVTVYRMVQGQRCAFVGPKVYWLEAYASKSNFSEVPNSMWADRKSGQLEKCAEAGALRAAFPEELGNEYAAEEMYGRKVDYAPPPPVSTNEITPPRPKKSEFERAEKKTEPAKQTPAAESHTTKKDAAPAKPQGDPRPEPPVEGVVEDPKPKPVSEPVDAEEVEEAVSEPVEPEPEEDPAADIIQELLVGACEHVDTLTRINDISDYRVEIAKQLPNDLASGWNQYCYQRQRNIAASATSGRKKSS